ncbi:unnamed protein product [Phytophthora fragariaefolia]|uniref:Unnamed protein product n=1 Tax=Phytophthora fragariaefolia TaxID=1490495 RepID=A0A9W6X158_9STRA|nr:unnamed protein product [Phytophthora fragariaefolia]
MPRLSLQCVEVVLRQHPSTPLDVGPIISGFLGPPVNLSLAGACRFGSIQLLQWMWDISPVEARGSQWRVTNFLRSDVHYARYQFEEAMKVAAGRGDLAVVQWLCERFPDGDVSSEVVETAARAGHLAILTFLLTHDAGSDPGNKNGRVSHGVVHWGSLSCEEAIRCGHADTARWLFKTTKHGMDGRQRGSAIKVALEYGDLGLAEMLLPRGRCILDYARLSPRPELIEWNYECGYLKRDSDAAAVAVRDLASTGRLDLMKRIFEEHSPSADSVRWRADWEQAITNACSSGGITQLQWLLEHPLGRAACEAMRQVGRLYILLYVAAQEGFTEVMQYIYDQGAVDTFGDALLVAIRNGKMETVKWLVEHFPRSEYMPNYCVLVEASRHGRLEMLQYFQSLYPATVPGFSFASSDSRQLRKNQPFEVDLVSQTSWTHRERNLLASRQGQVRLVAATDGHLRVTKASTRRSEWCSTDAMDEAAANGQQQVLQWLHENRPEGSTTTAMNEAAANGFMEVVQWLQTNRSEGCTSRALEYAARTGHLNVVQWLYQTLSAKSIECVSASRSDIEQNLREYSIDAMDFAAAGGHLEVMKWLCVHQLGGCTSDTITLALCHGHLRVAQWIQQNFPECIPNMGDKVVYGTNKFDILLFLHAHYPSVFTSQFVRIHVKSFERSHDARVLSWMEGQYLHRNATQATLRR